MDYILETEQLCKKYKNFDALNNVSVHIPKGAIYGLVGQNGAGKTTLLRIISGVQRATSGTVSIAKDKDGNRLKMNGIIENASINMSLSVKDNIVAQNILSGQTSNAAIDEILNSVGLLQAKDKKAKDLSLGMRQRLAIAKTMLNKPDILLLDEPMNGLDPMGIVEIRNILLELNRDFGVTIIISSHILGELAKVATCYGFISNGTLMKEISAEELPEDLEQYFIDLVGGQIC